MAKYVIINRIKFYLAILPSLRLDPFSALGYSK
jgi:hypothetical protein